MYVLTWYDIHMNRICVHLKGHVDHSQREGVVPGGKVDHMEDGEGGVYQRGGLAYQCGRYGGRVEMVIRGQLPEIVHHTLHM